MPKRKPSQQECDCSCHSDDEQSYTVAYQKNACYIQGCKCKYNKPDRTTEESEGEYVLCSITDSIFKTHLLKEDPLCRKLFLQNVRDYLKSERKKLAKQIINEIAVMTIYEDHETPPAGQIIKMIKEKALKP